MTGKFGLEDRREAASGSNGIGSLSMFGGLERRGIKVVVQ